MYRGDSIRPVQAVAGIRRVKASDVCDKQIGRM